ncbi:hypothetical protein BDV59DRAFT_189707 [Aspergillus ambiguus]|uniref:uncharacterized protein n=1 Tax=Aspergillus ambiguus TaxID=176160 RepID=UPI003CCD6AF9
MELPIHWSWYTPENGREHAIRHQSTDLSVLLRYLCLSSPPSIVIVIFVTIQPESKHINSLCSIA